MIWICDVQVLVMACNVQEAGKTKCETYWPLKGEIKHFGNISIELIETSQVCPDFMVRTLLVKCDSEMRDVYQFHYTSWPDHGVPDSVQPILELVRLMRNCQPSETVPIVIHCSAGCGRTGTICAVDYVWACLRQGKLDEDFSLFHIALELRRQRIAMIQTKEQYMLAHRAVATMFEQQLNVIDNHTYENIDEDGEPLMWKELMKNKGCSLNKEVVQEENICRIRKESQQSGSECSPLSETKEKASSGDDSSQSKTVNSVVLNHRSSVDASLSKVSSDSVINSSKSSECSFSRNSCLSQHTSEDTIPFIDEDEISVRPNCGRAYLDIPSVDSFSKLINSFDPFVDKVSLGTDDSSPEGDVNIFPGKESDCQSFQLNNPKYETKVSNFLEKGKEIADTCVNTEDKPLHKLDDCILPVISSGHSSKTILNNRGSYPSYSSKTESAFSDLIEDVSVENSESCETQKKVGKATVVRRPSISKLKALFERSSIYRNSTDGSKRSLFRHNSQHVSRAGSAPPSLNCMDKNSAHERESILMMVTRKFRSSSVRSEREINSKPPDKSLHRKSGTGTMKNFKDSLSTLSRTVSFNLSKTFQSYTPSKSKAEKPASSIKHHVTCINDTPSLVSYKPKTPDSEPMGKSMWYDKSSFPRVVAIVKPTEKIDDCSPLPPPPPPPPKDTANKQTIDKDKHHDLLSACISKPPKLLPFFSNLNKNECKDVSTMWYSEADNVPTSELTKNKAVPISTNFESSTLQTKGSIKRPGHKVLPFIQSITPWKKSLKSPLSSPESPKNFDAMEPDSNLQVCNSKFYTEVKDDHKLPKVAAEFEDTKSILPCPVPEEIIPINPKTEKEFWPSNSVTSAEKSDVKQERALINQTELQNKNILTTEKEIAEVTVTETDVIMEQKKLDSQQLHEQSAVILKNSESESNDSLIISSQKPAVSNETDASDIAVMPKLGIDVIEKQTKIKHDQPPAIPKKMLIGKNRNFEFQNCPKEKKTEDNDNLSGVQNSLLCNETGFISNASNLTVNTNSAPAGKCDAYINVNITAKKNIEQIENTLRKFPRGAIIDLTSRESYSMEEELANAVKQLSEASEKNKTAILKNNSKFPGYEVIWPEEKYSEIIQLKKSGDAVLSQGRKMSDVPKAEAELLNRAKTGVCYSPPLRRSCNSVLHLSKSQSCSSINWLEPDDVIEASTEQTVTGTKKLVDEAAVELNALLNQLTSKTLTEDNNFVSRVKKDSHSVPALVTNEPNISFTEQSNKESMMVHSVTLVSKSSAVDSCAKEEEIIFHFPPPPPLPPPPDDQPSESFNIICKNGSLIVSESNTNNASAANISSARNADSLKDKSEQNFPKPSPRKSKQVGALQRSASYTMLSIPQKVAKGYENIFLDKYQTISHLQINSKTDKNKQNNKKGNIIVPNIESSRTENEQKLPNKMPNYVNINELVKVSDLKVYDSKRIQNDNGLQPDRNELLKCPPPPAVKSTIVQQSDSERSGIYGKICKIKDGKVSTENASLKQYCFDNKIDSIEMKRKNIPSKKCERAPLPPDIKLKLEDLPSKITSSNSTSSKKLPSRKLEKAPLPPPLLQKSASAVSIPKKISSSQQYTNLHSIQSHPSDEPCKLPALRENIPNVMNCPEPSNRKAINNDILKNTFSGRGLSHSQSDVSVYRALKEQKAESMRQRQKVSDVKPVLMNKTVKQTRNFPSVSSSDSDGSYEHIFLTKSTEQRLPKINLTEQKDLNSVKQYRKEIPVAPPRSKRRSTMEIQYAKVKAKEVSSTSSDSSTTEQHNQLKNSKKEVAKYSESPPVIPLKTKDAFEVPEGFNVKGHARVAMLLGKPGEPGNVRKLES
ncbi:Tyrosine-protein phosphatase non-receptor type 12, partial [Stegodyphus mimosarum]